MKNVANPLIGIHILFNMREYITAGQCQNCRNCRDCGEFFFGIHVLIHEQSPTNVCGKD